MHFVPKRFRRKGIAKKLTYRLIAVARRMGYRGISIGLAGNEILGLGEKMATNPRAVLRAGYKEKNKAPERVSVEVTYKKQNYRVGTVKINFNPLKKGQKRVRPK